MNVQKIIKKGAKHFHKLSFEMKILVGLLLYILFIIEAALSLIKRGAATLTRYTVIIRKSLNTIYHKVFLRPLFSSLLQRISTLRFQQAPALSKQRRQRAVTRQQGRSRGRRTLLLLSFQTKVKYFLFGTTFSTLFIFLPLLALIFLQDLPNPTELTSRQIPQTTKIFDRNGILLAEVYSAQNRTLVSLGDIPQYLQQATLAIEDKNFYKHPGFDIASIVRAARENLSGKPIQGGSTITQQLIKSSMLTNKKSISRKVRELILAFWAERIYTKPQILEMYFNQVPYGGTAWGIEAASEVYFGKPVKKLTLSESAFLAGLTSAPSIYSPFGEYPKLWKKRQEEVLGRMVSLGYISQKQAESAAKESLRFKKQQVAYHAPHFVEYIKNILIKTYGLAMVEKGGLQVITTLDLKLQSNVQKIVAEEVTNAQYLNLTNGATVVTDPRNGDILAMVGSKDFSDPNGGNVNIATSYRQPGSTVKIITYSAALSNGFTAASILDDTPQTFGVNGSRPYAPVNYDGRYFGKVPLRFALANSLNLPAVKILNQIGVPTMVSLAREMGIETWDNTMQYGLSVTLGGAEVTMLDMATANGVLANQGVKITLNPLRKITDGQNQVLEEKKTNTGYRVLNRGVAFIVSDILADNQTRTAAFGPNSPLTIPGHTVSVKTGTTDNKRDNWTIGYTNNFVVVVWVGNNDNSPMSQSLASGITGAAPIWNRVMTQLLKNFPEMVSTPPTEITQRLCFGRKEYFLKGTEQQVRCSNSPLAPSLYYSVDNQRH